MQWNHTIPDSKVNGILIGYRVSWDDSIADHPQKVKAHKDLELEATNYTIMNLHEHWRYEIGVAGRTAVGPGVFERRIIMTPDDGKKAGKYSFQLYFNRVSNSARWLVSIESLSFLRRPQ